MPRRRRADFVDLSFDLVVEEVERDGSGDMAGDEVAEAASAAELVRVVAKLHARIRWAQGGVRSGVMDCVK